MTQNNNLQIPAARVKTQRTLTQPELTFPKGYFRAAAIIASVVASVLLVIRLVLHLNGTSMRDISGPLYSVTAYGIFTLVMIFALHSTIKIRGHKRQVDAELQAHLAWLRAESERSFSLDIQGLGFGMQGTRLGQLWAELSGQGQSGARATSSAEPTSVAPLSVVEQAARHRKSAFHGAAANAVRYWPVPTFAVRSPQPGGEDCRTTDVINQGRNAALLGLTLFVAQADERSTHAQTMIERVFGFMEEHQRVPQVLLVTEEQRTAQNTGALLLARQDRVDHLEPFSTQDSPDNNDPNTWLGKLWAFYWQADREFAFEHANAQRAPDTASPCTLSSSYWQATLSRLRATLNDHNLGGFESSPWIPVPWADHQIAGFKATPVLGYLHRPVKIPAWLQTAAATEGLSPIESLKHGWIQAINTLALDERPVRVFYDGLNDLPSLAHFREAMSELNREGHGLDVSSSAEGYDLSLHAGYTGVSAALLLINLATVASYQSGGISAVVYGGADQSVTIQMVSPPSVARKSENLRNGTPLDPFIQD
ncbi:type VI lipase adapter Tla3 domain-containing protein [Pseudomonas huanghezhanensis]|uniref:type VI lipase adapter Tla3 domain-containing protein n=1 Tax=Pseudomonas huanghezhanensis TaxID=3002903 RepID=UPI0022867E15|nr:DUF2875 family protein [Pseudomonas sp. BSw22131]